MCPYMNQSLLRGSQECELLNCTVCEVIRICGKQNLARQVLQTKPGIYYGLTHTRFVPGCLPASEGTELYQEPPCLLPLSIIFFYLGFPARTIQQHLVTTPYTSIHGPSWPWSQHSSPKCIPLYFLLFGLPISFLSGLPPPHNLFCLFHFVPIEWFLLLTLAYLHFLYAGPLLDAFCCILDHLQIPPMTGFYTSWCTRVKTVLPAVFNL